MRINFLPVAITSLTTIVGFLSLNFSDSPPYWHLGNITAVGIFAAWIFSITVLPAAISLLPYKVKAKSGTEWSVRAMDRLSEFVIRRYRGLLRGCWPANARTLIAFIPTLDFNDQWVEYFDERIEFRVDSDNAQEHFGLYPIEYSIPANGPRWYLGARVPGEPRTIDGFHARAGARHARVLAVGHHEAPQSQHACR